MENEVPPKNAAPGTGEGMEGRRKRISVMYPLQLWGATSVPPEEREKRALGYILPGYEVAPKTICYERSAQTEMSADELDAYMEEQLSEYRATAGQSIRVDTSNIVEEEEEFVEGEYQDEVASLESDYMTADEEMTMPQKIHMNLETSPPEIILEQNDKKMVINLTPQQLADNEIVMVISSYPKGKCRLFVGNDAIFPGKTRSKDVTYGTLQTHLDDNNPDILFLKKYFDDLHERSKKKKREWKFKKKKKHSPTDSDTSMELVTDDNSLLKKNLGDKKKPSGGSQSSLTSIEKKLKQLETPRELLKFVEDMHDISTLNPLNMQEFSEAEETFSRGVDTLDINRRKKTIDPSMTITIRGSAAYTSFRGAQTVVHLSPDMSESVSEPGTLLIRKGTSRSSFPSRSIKGIKTETDKGETYGEAEPGTQYEKSELTMKGIPEIVDQSSAGTHLTDRRLRNRLEETDDDVSEISYSSKSSAGKTRASYHSAGRNSDNKGIRGSTDSATRKVSFQNSMKRQSKSIEPVELEAGETLPTGINNSKADAITVSNSPNTPYISGSMRETVAGKRMSDIKGTVEESNITIVTGTVSRQPIVPEVAADSEKQVQLDTPRPITNLIETTSVSDGSNITSDSQVSNRPNEMVQDKKDYVSEDLSVLGPSRSSLIRAMEAVEREIGPLRKELNKLQMEFQSITETENITSPTDTSPYGYMPGSEHTVPMAARVQHHIPYSVAEDPAPLVSNADTAQGYTQHTMHQVPIGKTSYPYRPTEDPYGRIPGSPYGPGQHVTPDGRSMFPPAPQPSYHYPFPYVLGQQPYPHPESDIARSNSPTYLPYAQYPNDSAITPDGLTAGPGIPPNLQYSPYPPGYPLGPRHSAILREAQERGFQTPETGGGQRTSSQPSGTASPHGLTDGPGIPPNLQYPSYPPGFPQGSLHSGILNEASDRGYQTPDSESSQGRSALPYIAAPPGGRTMGPGIPPTFQYPSYPPGHPLGSRLSATSKEGLERGFQTPDTETRQGRSELPSRAAKPDMLKEGPGIIPKIQHPSSRHPLGPRTSSISRESQPSVGPPPKYEQRGVQTPDAEGGIGRTRLPPRSTPVVGHRRGGVPGVEEEHLEDFFRRIGYTPRYTSMNTPCDCQPGECAGSQRPPSAYCRRLKRLPSDAPLVRVADAFNMPYANARRNARPEAIVSEPDDILYKTSNVSTKPPNKPPDKT